MPVRFLRRHIETWCGFTCLVSWYLPHSFSRHAAARKTALEATAALQPKCPMRPVTVEEVDTGFGQLERRRHLGGPTGGWRFVTANMNFLDAGRQILGATEQIESFSWAGQELVLPLPLDLSATPGAEVAEVEVSVSLSDYAMGGETVDPFEPVEARELRTGEFGGPTAMFEVANSTALDLEGARVGIVCRSADGEISGGTSEYPELIAAGKSVLGKSDIATSGEPASCDAYPNYGL